MFHFHVGELKGIEYRVLLVCSLFGCLPELQASLAIWRYHNPYLAEPKGDEVPIFVMKPNLVDQRP